MSKSKKKRNKQYRGADASQSQPVIHRYEAVERSRFGQWWFEHRKFIRFISIAVLVLVIVVGLILELIHILL